MKRVFSCCFSFVLMMVFAARSSKKQQEKDYQLLKALNASVEHATGMIEHSIYQYEKEWVKRQDDPVYTDLYSVWYPKLTNFVNKAKEIKADIDIIKKEILTKKDSSVGNQLEVSKANELYK